ncbi:MAG: acyl-CoA dehydrogenase, partial [Microcystaceae cyanobacterium]
SLAERAGWLNEGVPGCSVEESLTLLAESGQLAYGVPQRLGGAGGTLLDVVEAIATVSEQCLTSGFVFWCQRVLIECLVASPNRWLQEHVLPEMLRAECSGAAGLADVMKYLAGTERLPIRASLDAETVTVEGFLPWVSNLRPNNFVVAFAAQAATGESLIVAVPSSAQGLRRGEDLQLLGLQASWTSTLDLHQVRLSRQWLLSEEAPSFLSKIRPAFLLMQCGLALGMARRSLQETLQSVNQANEEMLINRLRYGHTTLANLEAQIWMLGILPAFNDSHLRQLFELRVALTRLALDSVWLELESKGGTAYFKPSGTARRLREAALLPILGPSLLQLEHELHQSAQVQMQRMKEATKVEQTNAGQRI